MEFAVSHGMFFFFIFAAFSALLSLAFISYYQLINFSDKQIEILRPYILQEYYSGESRAILIHLNENSIFEQSTVRVCDQDHQLVIGSPAIVLKHKTDICVPEKSEVAIKILNPRHDAVLELIGRRNFEIGPALVLCFLLFSALAGFYWIIGNWYSAYTSKIVTDAFETIPQLFEKLLSEESDLHDFPDELQSIAIKTNEIMKKNREFENEVIKTRLNNVRNEIAVQVAHDIRSPLSALNMAMGSSQNFTDQHRAVIRSAINRINEIANDLISEVKNRNSLVSDGPIVFHVPSAILSIIQEKRTQFYGRQDLEFFHIIKSSAVFVEGREVDFKVAVSNILNNAVEAIGEMGGKIEAVCEIKGGNAVLTISDNGKGMSQSAVQRLGRNGFSEGKQNSSSNSGTGLGLSHAFKTLESLKGTLDVVSVEGKGTDIILSFPYVAGPTWFATAITVKNISRIVVIDDDEAIHLEWKHRLSKTQVEIISHFDPDECKFEAWAAQSLWLIDYEFVGSQSNGLDLIRRLNLTGNAILVTNREPLKEFIMELAPLGVKFLPKSMISEVSILY